jgi:hypothetical protein
MLYTPQGTGDLGERGAVCIPSELALSQAK